MSMRTNHPVSSEPNSSQTTSARPTFKFDAIAKGDEVAGLSWNDLNETEKSAASLGVDSNAWKPIAFMNHAHYDTLLKKNAIDEELAKKLEAYRHVSTSEA
jgi:hypothetical protein